MVKLLPELTGSEMRSKILRLYPGPVQEVSVSGLYLAHRLHELGSVGAPYVYANFLASLDGRIALEDIDEGTSYIPKHLTTVSDFRLFMELHAQADCLITHGGYMRALSEKRLGNILQVGAKPEHSDLVAWRRKNGLPAQPAVVIASASLNFPMHYSLGQHRQRVYIATGQQAEPSRVKYWQRQGYSMLFTGNGKLVRGKQLITRLDKLGYKSVYLIAGPQMLDTIVRERQLDRLYQTITHQLLGGKDFRTLLPGAMLGTEGYLKLKKLYYDADSPSGAGQFFSVFEFPNKASLPC